MRRPAFKGPGAHLGVEVGEQAGGGYWPLGHSRTPIAASSPCHGAQVWRRRSCRTLIREESNWRFSGLW
jgi:hypothetical protein